MFEYTHEKIKIIKKASQCKFKMGKNHKNNLHSV